MSQPRFVWTYEMTRYLRKNREKTPPMSWIKIANKLSLSVVQCQDKMNRIRESMRDTPRPEGVARHCLNCQEKFLAPTKFIRVCNKCKQSQAWR